MAQDMMGTQIDSTQDLVQRLSVESDKRLGKFMGVFGIVGAAFISYAMTVEIMIPVALYNSAHKEDTAQVVMKLGEVEKKMDEEKKKKANAPPKPRKKSGGGAKARGKGVPNAPVTQAALKLITSRTSSSCLSSYDLMNQKFAEGLDKVINNVSGLTKTGQTRLGGRRGQVDGGWNAGYAVGGSGGVDDLLGGVWGGDAG